jgi:hypothetical protein
MSFSFILPFWSRFVLQGIFPLVPPSALISVSLLGSWRRRRALGPATVHCIILPAPSCQRPTYVWPVWRTASEVPLLLKHFLSQEAVVTETRQVYKIEFQYRVPCTFLRPQTKYVYPPNTSLKNTVFWDVTPCRSCVNRRFGGTCTRSTRRHIPEDGILHSRRRENLKSNTSLFQKVTWNVNSNKSLQDELERYTRMEYRVG